MQPMVGYLLYLLPKMVIVVLRSDNPKQKALRQNYECNSNG